MDQPEQSQAVPRDYLAVERTFLAWIRTGLALMGLGFVLARFGIFLRQFSFMRSGLATASFAPSLWFGTLLLLLGVAVCLWSLSRYLRLVRSMRAGSASFSQPSMLAVAVASILAVLGLAMGYYLISTRQVATGRSSNNPQEVSMSTITDNGVVRVASQHTVGDTVAKLESILQAKNVKLFTIVDHSGEAASSGLQMPNTKLLIFGNPKAGTPLPNVIALMFVGPHSWRGERGLQRRRRIHHLAVLARLIECQNASRRLDVETAVFVLQVLQILRGDAVILGAEEEQGHRRVPGEVERLAKDQEHLPVPVEHGALDHVAGQGAEQRKSDRDLFEPVRAGIARYAAFVEVAEPMLGRHHALGDEMAARHGTEFRLQLACELGHRGLDVRGHLGAFAQQPPFDVAGRLCNQLLEHVPRDVLAQAELLGHRDLRRQQARGLDLAIEQRAQARAETAGIDGLDVLKG